MVWASTNGRGPYPQQSVPLETIPRVRKTKTWSTKEISILESLSFDDLSARVRKKGSIRKNRPRVVFKRDTGCSKRAECSRSVLFLWQLCVVVRYSYSRRQIRALVLRWYCDDRATNSKHILLHSNRRKITMITYHSQPKIPAIFASLFPHDKS